MVIPAPIPGPAYRIVTPRLVIRCPDPLDTALLHTAIRESRDNLLPWMRWAKPEKVSFQERLDFVRKIRGDFNLGNNFEYLIFDPTETSLLGAAGLHKRTGIDAREIGYWIHSVHLNQGYATEASGTLTRVAFEIEYVHRVQIQCDPENIRSVAIPRKLGFIHEATLHARIEDATPDLRDTMIWSLFDVAYPGSPCAQIEIQAFDALGRRII